MQFLFLFFFLHLISVLSSLFLPPPSLHSPYPPLHLQSSSLSLSLSISVCLSFCLSLSLSHPHPFTSPLQVQALLHLYGSSDATLSLSLSVPTKTGDILWLQIPLIDMAPTDFMGDPDCRISASGSYDVNNVNWPEQITPSPDDP